VVVAAANAAAVGHADQHLRRVLARAAVAVLRELAHDLIERGEDEVCELNLDDRAEAIQRHADRHADDASLRERRVEHALRAVLLLQPLCHAEHAAEVADIFAEDHRALVALHVQVQRLVQRLEHVHGRSLSHGFASQ